MSTSTTRAEARDYYEDFSLAVGLRDWLQPTSATRRSADRAGARLVTGGIHGVAVRLDEAKFEPWMSGDHLAVATKAAAPRTLAR